MSIGHRRISVLLTSMGRLAAITRACLRHGCAHLLQAGFPSLARRLKIQDLDGPTRLRRTFEDVGGTFIKFGQMLALQPDIVSVAYCNALFKLLDRVDPFPWEDVDRIVREELGQPPDEVFDEIERRPLATASVGQVHVAWLDGEKVAVKVQRPNVETDFRSDVLLMTTFIKVVQSLRLRFLSFLVEPVEEFVCWTEEELDYRYEARYGMRLRQHARDNPVQYVPRVYTRFTTRRTLVVEFLDGVTLLDYLRAQEEGDEVLLSRLASRGFDRTRFSANVIDNFLGDCFRHGLYHADLHPANLMILDDSVVGYIDFGITGAMSPYSRRHLVAMTLALAQGDTDALHQEFLKLSVLTPNADPQELHRGLADLSEVWYQGQRGQRQLQVSFTQVCRDMLAVSRKTGVLPERDIIKYIRSAIAIDGLCSRFKPNFHVGERLALVCARQIRQQTASAALQVSNLLATSASSARLLVDGPVRSTRLLDRLAAGELPVHAQAVSHASKEDVPRERAVRLAALAATLTLLMTLEGDAATLGWNLFTAELLLAALSLAFLVPTMRRLMQSPAPRADS